MPEPEAPEIPWEGGGGGGREVKTMNTFENYNFHDDCLFTQFPFPQMPPIPGILSILCRLCGLMWAADYRQA